jgi:hypothetical protein
MPVYKGSITDILKQFEQSMNDEGYQNSIDALRKIKAKKGA